MNKSIFRWMELVEQRLKNNDKRVDILIEMIELLGNQIKLLEKK